ncbi:MAG: hypothetical protein OHK0012_27620 [Synechococcales cyanobacterium]
MIVLVQTILRLAAVRVWTRVLRSEWVLGLELAVPELGMLP